MSVDEFGDAVEEGIKLAKRIYYGKDRSMAPPSLSMVRTSRSYLPPAPMVYAVISDPGIVDNPDIPSYQPYVHGRCDPPALIPLQMNAVSLEADCYLDTVFVTFSGTWRVHCVMGSKSCDCRLAVPMGEQGSLLGVEVDIPRKSYHTQLVRGGDEENEDKDSGLDGGNLTPNIVTLTIPQVDGGTNINIKMRWSQKISYHDGDFSVIIPFSFPEYVTPAVKKIPKREKIRLSVNYGHGNEILCKNCSHSLKEQRRQPGNLSFLHETDVLSWSSIDFTFSYNVPASHISGNVFVKSPSTDDVDQREMFTLQILPGTLQKEVLRRKIVYVVDVSMSMEGKPLDDTKSVLSTALSLLHPQDSFNIVAFNGGTFQYSPSLKQASKDTIEEAKEWIDKNFIAGDGTNILLALTQAIEMLSDSRDSIPMIFLVTDGSVEDERHICDTARICLSNCKTVSPRIHTFGIGTYCNHYFLQMLAMIGRGYYDSAFDPDSIHHRLGNLISRGASTIFSNVTVDALSNLDDVEIYSSSIPDLSSESPLSISGRYCGNFPDVIKAEGVIAGMKKIVIDLKVHKPKEIPIDKIVAMQQIATCTAQAWFSEDKQIVKKVAELSMSKGIVSEYTLLSWVETEKPLEVKGGKKKLVPKKTEKNVEKQKEISRTIMVKSLGVGFGNLQATEENSPPGYKEEKPQQAAEIIVKAATSCCSQLCGMCCCMCCIQACNKMNNQCAIALAQLCSAFACFGCLECCADVCCGGQD